MYADKSRRIEKGTEWETRKRAGGYPIESACFLITFGLEATQGGNWHKNALRKTRETVTRK